MYKDVISYELAPGITEAHLLSVAQRIINSWMKQVPGFIRWEINKGHDGGYTDVVFWESVEHAKAAEKDMINIPDAHEWYGCYKDGSIKAFGMHQLAEF